MNEIKYTGNNGSKTINSREVATMVDMRHDHLLDKIAKIISDLDAPIFRVVDFFIKSEYKDSKGESRKCYELTRKGCEFIASKMTGQKGNEFTYHYVNRFNEMEEALKIGPLTNDHLSAFRVSKGFLEDFGICKNSALISANNHVEEVFGINPMKVLHIELPEERQETTYTPTELGKMMPNPVGAVAINKLLAKKGYQAKIDRRWIPTDEGKKHCKIIDTGKKHSSGAPVEQIKWYKSAID